MSYIVIPGLQVQAANMITSQIAIGGPPLTAAYGFAHALCRPLGVGVESFAYIHHAIAPLVQHMFGIAYPQQRRAAALTFTNDSRRDYSSKNPHALSLQPTATAHMRLSLVIHTDAPVRVKDPIDLWLATARFAGGIVVGRRQTLIAESVDEAFDPASMQTGFGVVDRRDLLDESLGPDPASLLVEALGAEITDDNKWLSATTVGYAAITAFACRSGAREGYPHAFAEPLIGLVQHRPMRELTGALGEIFWQPRWLHDDVFVLQQEPGSATARAYSLTNPR